MAIAAQDTLAGQFHERIHSQHMYGLWELASAMTPCPQPQAIPYMWPAEVIDEVVDQSGRAVPVGEERRAMQLFNPGLNGRWATTNTLVAAVQVLLPGEVARAHRHTPAAIRFIMKGSGAYTKVDSERVYMNPGDLILTPSWTWHDHGNDGHETVVWLDGLDVPLVQSLDAIFFKPYEQRQVPDSKQLGESANLHGHPGLAPVWLNARQPYSRLLKYPWETAWEALTQARSLAGDPFDGIAFEYTNPQTGGPVLPTMGCSIQLIRPGEHLKAHRHTGTAVYYAVRGRGRTVIDGIAFDWGAGSVVVVPSWAAHEHANLSDTEDAVLFSLHDAPLMQTLGLFYEEALNTNDAYQTVASFFRDA